jgi:hypothetical protein
MAERWWLGTRQMSSAFLAYTAAGLLLLVAILQIETPQAFAAQRARAPINHAARFVADKVSGNRIETSRSSSRDHAAGGPGLSITMKPVQSFERTAPAITKVSPISGPSTGATAVTITGTNFASNARVEFGSTASTKVSFVSTKEIMATSASEAPGTVDVRVMVGKHESPVVAKDKFTFTPPACTDSWTGAADSSWSTSGNWSKKKVPGAKDVACILTGKPGLPVQLASSASVATVTNKGGLQISGSLGVKAGNSTSSGPLTIDDGGTFSGPGTLTVTGTFTALGGILTGGQLVNEGTGTIDSSGQLSLESSATFTNSGTLIMDEGSNIDGYGCGSAGVFDNAGTLDVAPGSSKTAFIGDEECGLTVNNSARIELSSGTLENEDSDGFTFNLDTGSSITGTGTFVDEGDLVANAAASLPTLAIIGGSISGAGDVTVTGTLTTSYATFSGSGTVTVTGTFTAPGGTTILTGGQLVNQGTGTLDSSDQLSVASGATFTNSGTLTMGQSSNIDGYGCGSAGVFDNTGTLDVAPGSSQTAYIGEEECGLTVNNTATIDLQSGTFEYEDSDGFAFNLNTGSSITGLGTFEDVGDLVANAAVSLPTLAVSGGSISGSGNVTVTGTLTISYATFSGPGTVTATGTFTALAGTTILTGGQLVNKGSGTLDTSDGLFLANGATFTNSGTLTMDQSSTIDGYGCATAGVFDDTGTLDVAPGSSQTAYIGEEECGLTVNNSAKIDLQSGTFENEDSDGFSFNLDTGSSITGTGTFEDEGDLVASATVSMSTLNMAGGTLELAPQVDIDATSFSGTSGTVQLNAGSATQFGQIVATSANPTDLSLDLNPTFSPTCGESVTALQAGSVAGPFESAGGPAPFGGTWAVFSTSTSAGALVEC